MTWAEVIGREKQKDYFKQLLGFLQQEKRAGKIILPEEQDVFRATDETSLDSVRVVILGQDPYPQIGQAHGLSFSVREGVKIPPSLRNIYKEIERDVGKKSPVSGDLSRWAGQGVLLLNSVLTVEQGKAGSHVGKGWENYTDALIRAIGRYTDNTVFLLWGTYAQKKGQAVDKSNHLVLSAPHPSPLSAYRGFLGCRHFSQANDYLKQHGRGSIDW